MRHVFFILFALTSVLGFAQNGKISGKVFDDATGETLVGVTVVIKGTINGTITDFDGNFTFDVAPGSYQVQVSYISYQTLLLENVVVKANETTTFGNLRMKESTLELGEVTVTAKAIRTTESALQSIKRKSAVMMDGISAAKMKLIGDGTAVEAAKRVTGVSIEGGKYVYVRGLGDRYSKTTLHGIDIPGLDPDKNSLQMDIFPTNLISNIIISKNFTADMPADFTGGLVNIETKDIPEEKIRSVSFGIGYNPDMHFQSDYLSYEGGSTDFLGFDDGTRKLPEGASKSRIPTPISGHSSQETSDFIKSFNPNLAAQRKTSLLDYSASFTLGNQIALNNDSEAESDRKLGYIFSISYKSGYNYYSDVEYGEYQRSNASDEYEMRYATKQTGDIGERSTLVGLLGGLSYINGNSKLKLTAMHLQNAESRAGIFNIDNDGQAVGQSGYLATSHNLEYNQRSLTNLLLNGNHKLGENGWELDWKISPTLSLSNDPDIRKTAFTLENTGPTFSAGAGGNPARIWRSLDEMNLGSKADITKKYKFRETDAKLKFGISHTFKLRNYEILFFDAQFFGSQPKWDSADPSLVLRSENLYPQSSIYYQSGNSNPSPNTYSSNVHNTAAYISNEIELLPKLKTILGVRIENYIQRHTGRDQTYASGDHRNGRNLDNEKVLESIDFFPSVNLVYALTEKQNIRTSYSRTIARPSFKELSFAQILDPISNRIFNGSLFTYSDWAGDLTETRIDNLDLRWEMFLEGGQSYSVSAFMKRFNNPIELVRIPEQQTSTEYQPRNVGDGLLYGLELEFRKNLNFISPALKPFNVNANFTYVESKIEMTDTEFNSRKGYQKVGEEVKNSRQMAGQSPYVINAGLTYGNQTYGIDAGLFYNVKGSTLQIVGAGLFPDIYNKSFHSLNFSLNKKFGQSKNTSIDLKVANLLNSKNEIVYKSYQAADQIYETRNQGTTFSLGFSHKF